MADGDRANRSVRVDIYGQNYTIRTEDSGDRLLALADMVDQRMKEIARGTSTVDSLKVAILAALHIAEELHQAQQQLADYDRNLADRSTRCANELDRFLRRYVLEDAG